MPTPRSPKLRLECLEARDVPAALGELDPTFGVGGIAPAALTADGLGRFPVAVDAANRTLVFGRAPSGYGVTRLTPTGTPDPTFGTGGTASLTFFFGGFPQDLTAAPDGSVYVQAGGGVARLTPAGVPDPTFGTGGFVSLAPPGGTFGSFVYGGLAVDANGRVIVAGRSTADGATVVRLTPAGLPDATFGTAGRAVLSGAPAGAPGEIAVDPLGRVVVQITGDFGAPITVARLTSAGQLDATFDGDGYAIPVGLGGFAGGLVVDPVGNVFLSTGAKNASGAPARVTKLTPTGAADPTFGVGGTFTLTGLPGLPTQGTALAVLPDGRVVAVSSLETDDRTAPVPVTAFLLTPTGELDPTFNPTGPTPGVTQFLLPHGPESTVDYSRVSSLDVTPDGNIVVAGFASDGRMFAARLGGPGGGRLEIHGLFEVLLPSELPTLTHPVTPIAAGPALVLRLPDGTSLDPFGDGFTGGASVAAVDLDGDGTNEFIVAAGDGGGARVVVVGRGPDGAAVVRTSFLGIDDPNFRGGARVAVADVNHDGTPDLIVAAGNGGGPRVAVWDGRTLLGGTPVRLTADFFAFPGADAETLRNGAFVAAGDVDGDGFADLIFGGGPGGAARVLVVSGATLTARNTPAAFAAPVADFVAGGNLSARNGVRVGVTDLDADGRADLVVGTAPPNSPPVVWAYPGQSVTGTTEPADPVALDPHGAGARAIGVPAG